MGSGGGRYEMGGSGGGYSDEMGGGGDQCGSEGDIEI